MRDVRRDPFVGVPVIDLEDMTTLLLIHADAENPRVIRGDDRVSIRLTCTGHASARQWTDQQERDTGGSGPLRSIAVAWTDEDQAVSVKLRRGADGPCPRFVLRNSE